MSSSIEFSFNKKVVYILQTVITIVFVIFTCLIFGLLHPLPQKDVLGVLLIDIFYVCFFYWHTKHYFLPTIKGKPALEISQEGIIIYVDSVTIKWNQIINFRYLNGGLDKAILVYVYDKQEIVSERADIFQKIFSLLSFYNKTSISIRTLPIKGKTKDIFKLLTDHLKQTQDCA